jgi:hypothetical protein
MPGEIGLRCCAMTGDHVTSVMPCHVSGMALPRHGVRLDHVQASLLAHPSFPGPPSFLLGPFFLLGPASQAASRRTGFDMRLVSGTLYLLCLAHGLRHAVTASKLPWVIPWSEWEETPFTTGGHVEETPFTTGGHGPTHPQQHPDDC